MGQKLDNPTGQ